MTTHAKPTEHNKHKPAVPAVPAPTTTPTILNAGITQLNLFGQTVNVKVPTGTAAISGYSGNPLFITGITLPTDSSPLLVFKIDDAGPPVNWPPANSWTKNVSAQVNLFCGWLNAQYTTTATLNPVSYTGGPIVLIGQLGADGNLIPQVAAWESPDQGDVEYVMVLSAGNQIEVRWLDNAPDALSTPTTAHVIKPPAGPGVAGPFGLGTP
jgi:hypothetical protein